MTLSLPSPPSALPLPRRKLPIGIQTFAKLREQNCNYVEKTALAMQLSDSKACRNIVEFDFETC